MEKRIVIFCAYCLMYAGILVLILASLREREEANGFRPVINFEYKVF